MAWLTLIRINTQFYVVEVSNIKNYIPCFCFRKKCSAFYQHIFNASLSKHGSNHSQLAVLKGKVSIHPTLSFNSKIIYKLIVKKKI